MMFNNSIGQEVPRHAYLVPEQPIIQHAFTPHTIGNEFPIMVQLVTSMDRRHVQLVTMPLPTII